MDDVEPVELVSQSLMGISADVTVKFHFKSGTTHDVSFTTPVDSPVYGEPLTVELVYNIITSALATAESPYLILPCGKNEQMFVDLNSVDYVKVLVEPHA